MSIYVSNSDIKRVTFIILNSIHINLNKTGTSTSQFHRTWHPYNDQDLHIILLQ